MKNENDQVNMFRDSPWPGKILSNFAETPFTFDGVKCACSEAFIQSLKIEDPTNQKDFCLLQGQEAWQRGSGLTKNIFVEGKVWWKGQAYKLHSIEHFALVKNGLREKFSQSEEARRALIATQDATLIHDYGQPPGKKQSLPVEIFCDIVTEIRRDIQCQNMA